MKPRTSLPGEQIVWAFVDDGAFVVGDPTTGRTAYAYATSAHAVQAARNPDFEAALMIGSANRYGGPDPAQTDAYDQRQWQRLEAAGLKRNPGP